MSEAIVREEGNLTGLPKPVKPISVRLCKSYMQKQLVTNSRFYKEALMSLGKLEVRKGVPMVQKWDEEHVFFNPLLTLPNGKTLTPTKYCEDKGIYKLEQLLEEKSKETRKLPYDRVLTNIFSKITVNASATKYDVMITYSGEEIKFTDITHKQLYEESISKSTGDHISQTKWVEKMQTSVNWEQVWKTVNNILSTNVTKNVIWQQLHLNFYTQYSYNKWHKQQDKCPLCQKLPENIFHIILHCDFTKQLWKQIEPMLKDLHPFDITDEEKAFGIVQKKETGGIILRNWITYLLREKIRDEEREAYYSSRKPDISKFKKNFNHVVASEVKQKYIRCKFDNKLACFEKIMTHSDILCKKRENEEYEIKPVFK